MGGYSTRSGLWPGLPHSGASAPSIGAGAKLWNAEDVGIDLYIGEFGPDGPHGPDDVHHAGSISDRDIRAMQSLVQSLELEVELAPTADFTLSREEVAHSAGLLDEVVRTIESTGADLACADLCIALRRAADEGQGLSGYGD